MRIIVIGPTLLTRNCVEALCKNGEEVVAIYTLHEKFSQAKSRFAPMDDLAEKYGVNLFKVENINDSAVIEQIRSLRPDVIFELGWSQIISSEILKIPPRGCIGVHASLLPRNRGAASLNWAIINGQKTTGVSLFYLAGRPDDGDIIAQKEFDIDHRDDINTLHAKSDLASVELLLENIDDIRDGTVRRISQNSEEVTYTKRRKPEDGFIEWDKSSEKIYDWIRAQTQPFPGAFTHWNGKKLYVWSAETTDYPSHDAPGKIFRIIDKKGVLVNTRDRMIMMKMIQAEGEVQMWADDFCKKYGMAEGDVLV